MAEEAKRVSHAELIDMAREHGISIEKITREYAYVNEVAPTPEKAQLAEVSEPSQETEPDVVILNDSTGLCPVPVKASWHDRILRGGPALLDLIRDQRRAMVERVIFQNTGMALLEVKTMVEGNWKQWQSEYNQEKNDG